MAEETRNSFATVSDINELFRELSTEEETRANKLLPIVSDSLRYEAFKVGKDLDDKQSCFGQCGKICND